MKTKIVLFALIATIILSCNNQKKKDIDIKQSDETSEMSVSIEDSRWVINTLDGLDISKTATNEQEIFFILNSKTKRVSGNAGCNTFMGSYTLEEGNSISFSPLATTRMICPDSNINESQVLKIFETVDNYTINNGILSLHKDKNKPLATFKKVEMATNKIVEKYWKLTILEGKEIKTTKNQEKEVYFTLKIDENKIIGFAGCNSLGGKYELEGNKIKFQEIITTKMACPDVDFNESKFLSILSQVDNYTIHNDVLSLKDNNENTLAIFEAVYMQ